MLGHGQKIRRYTRPSITPEIGQAVDNIEQFICLMSDGWYIEDSAGEAGPYPTLREAEAHRGHRVTQ